MEEYVDVEVVLNRWPTLLLEDVDAHVEAVTTATPERAVRAAL